MTSRRRSHLGLGLVTLLGALAAPGSALAGSSPQACVLSLSGATGRHWSSLLQPYRISARTIPVTSAQASALASCDVRIASSDSALYWKSDPGAAERLLGTEPTLVMGAATRPVLEALHPALAESAREARSEGDRLWAEEAAAPILAGPFAVPAVQRDDAMILCREDSTLVALAASARRAGSELTVYCTERDAPVVFRSGNTIFWGIGASADDLTASGRTLLANLVHSLAPAAAPARERPTERSSRDPSPARTEPPARPAKVIDAGRAENAPQIDFSATANRGPRSIRAMRGDTTIVVFWATWCGPCRKAMPGVVETARALDREGIEIVAVSVDQDADKAIEHARKNRYDLPISVAGPGAQRRFGLSGIPGAVLIDRKGRIRGTYGAGNLEQSGAVAAARHVREKG